MTTGPLDDVRVLDLTRLLPGAYATLLLVDLGADVVKIEDPRGGDGMRTLGPLASGRHGFFERLNRGKHSVALDLRAPEAAAVLDALVARADVVVDSFRPSTARRLGVDAEATAAPTRNAQPTTSTTRRSPGCSGRRRFRVRSSATSARRCRRRSGSSPR